MKSATTGVLGSVAGALATHVVARLVPWIALAVVVSGCSSSPTGSDTPDASSIAEGGSDSPAMTDVASGDSDAGAWQSGYCSGSVSRCGCSYSANGLGYDMGCTVSASGVSCICVIGGKAALFGGSLPASCQDPLDVEVAFETGCHGPVP
jgi:hypothetical protein